MQTSNHRKRKPVSEINVVPYIDVMLVLLVIFMITAPMLTQGVEVELPKTPADPVKNQNDNEHLIVSVDFNGQYFIERGQDKPEPVKVSAVGSYVGKVLKQSPQTTVLVRGDKRVPYGTVVELMTILQKAGATSVGLVTEAP
ncbi:protein TolR [Gynuella sp.]|uniref:protein TolR n=1 Tax=Gynuella sp. TaxID=2969146 RepID=UPI003D0B77B7